MRVLCGFLLASFALCACAQQATLASQNKLRETDDVSIDAFPRVVAGGGVTDAVAAKINVSLAKFDAQVMRDMRECAKAQREMTKGDSGTYSREVKVTMTGPRYLSFTADDGYDCGGVHPDDSSLALVYDLTTGSPVNWGALLPPAAKGKIFREKGSLPIGVVEWDAMTKRARAQATKDDEECGQAYDETPTFNVYLSADDHAVAFSPNLTPHINSALCTAVVLIKPTEAKRLGIAQPLIDAIAAAR